MAKRQGNYGHNEEHYKSLVNNEGHKFIRTWVDDKYRRWVEFVCKCTVGTEKEVRESRAWNNFSKTMLCDSCARKRGQKCLKEKRDRGEVARTVSSKRITVEDATAAVEANGCVFVSLTWIDGENSISYICECSKDDPNASHHKSTYYYIKSGTKCGECASERAQATIKRRRAAGELVIEQSNFRLDESVIEEFVESFDCVYLDSYFVGDRYKRIIKIFCSCSKTLAVRPIAHIYWDNFRTGARCVECAIARKKATCMERFGVEHIAQSKEVMEKIHNTMLLRYGARHLMHIPYWRKKIEKSMCRRQIVSIGNREYVYQGYEHHALMILYREGYDMSDVWGEDSYNCEEVPQFKYTCRGMGHVYYPDIYIRSERRFIEVKSERTMKMDPERIYDKLHGVQSYGFHIDLWIIDRDGSLIHEERFPAK